jgi:hypothetical protein
LNINHTEIDLNRNQESESAEFDHENSESETNGDEKHTIDTFCFYKDVLSELQKKSLDEIKPTKTLPLLAPLMSKSRDESCFNDIKIRLHKVS